MPPEARGRRRHVWGPLPGAAVAAAAAAAAAAAPPAPSRKRKSRWATGEEAAAPAGSSAADGSKAIVLFPEKVVLSNGLQVVLPPAVTGRAPGGDPEVLEFHKQVKHSRRTASVPPSDTVRQHLHTPTLAWVVGRAAQRASHNAGLYSCLATNLLQLNDINRKLLNGMVDIPPEGERSPSPPPVYDVMGMR